MMYYEKKTCAIKWKLAFHHSGRKLANRKLKRWNYLLSFAFAVKGRHNVTFQLKIRNPIFSSKLLALAFLLMFLCKLIEKNVAIPSVYSSPSTECELLVTGEYGNKLVDGKQVCLGILFNMPMKLNTNYLDKRQEEKQGINVS